MALVALIVLLGEVAWTVHRIRPKVEVTIANLDRTVIVAGAAATHLEKAAATWQKASEVQAENSSAVLKAAKESLNGVSAFVTRTDASLNQHLLPTIDSAISSQSNALLETQQQLQSNLQDMQRATGQLQATLADADAVIADPNLRASIFNLEQATANTSQAIAHLEGSLKDVQEVADYEKKQIMRPVALWKTIAKFLLQGGSQARILFAK